MNDIESLITNFTHQLAGLMESQTLERARQAVEIALGGKRPGRPTAHPSFGIAANPRKKPPVQLCPVPGCKNKAAPIFGMVCSDHKDVPKAKIKKYREARREAKAGGSPKGGAARKAKRRAANRRTRKTSTRS